MGLHPIQPPGMAVRIEAAAFRSIVAERPLLRRLVDEHLYALLRPGSIQG